MLIGRSAGGVTVVERVLSVVNASAASPASPGRRGRYRIDPETVLAAHKEARALGLDVVGYYHSHPDAPARPSEADREDAWPGVSYLIISSPASGEPGARSWRLREDRTGFEEEEIDR